MILPEDAHGKVSVKLHQNFLRWTYKSGLAKSQEEACSFQLHNCSARAPPIPDSWLAEYWETTQAETLNGLFKVKHPPARNSIGLLGSTSSWTPECYCIWKDDTERLSVKHERGVQHQETTAVQRTLIFHKHKLWNVLKTMADTKVWVNTLCSALLLHSCSCTVVQTGAAESSTTKYHEML